MLVILPALLVPLKLRLLAHIDLLGGQKGYFVVKVFGLAVLGGVAELEGNRLHITHKNCKTTRIKITPDKSDEESIVNYLDNAFLSVADVKKLYVYFNAGKSDNAAFAALAGAAGRVIINILLSTLRGRYPNLDYAEGAESNFDEDVLHLSVDSIINISIADIIYSLLYAKIRAVRKNRSDAQKSKN